MRPTLWGAFDDQLADELNGGNEDVGGFIEAGGITELTAAQAEHLNASELIAICRHGK